MVKNILYYLFLVLILVLLLILASKKSYFPLLSGDSYTYFSRVELFFRQNSLVGLQNNEYQPGAISFFLLLSPMLFVSNNINSFIYALIVANVVLIIILSLIYEKMTGRVNVLVFFLFLLCNGPIIFFRFDLFVITLTVLALIFWQKKHQALSAIFLGLATLVKVYPILFIPYLGILAIRKKGFGAFIKYFLIYLSTILIYSLIYYLLLKPPLSDIITNLTFHVSKPIHPESLWSLFTAITSRFSGQDPVFYHSPSGYGIKEVLLPSWFYDSFWMLPLGTLFIWIYKKSTVKLKPILDLRYPLIIIITFLYFSKLFTNQYYLWFCLMIPLIDKKRLLSRPWLMIIFLVSIVGLFQQYIYPVKYTSWVSDMSNFYTFDQFFLINILRFLCLLIVIIIIGKDIQKQPYPPNK